MTIAEADKALKQKLSFIYDDREATNITNLVMEHLTGFSKSQRLINKFVSLNNQQIENFKIYTTDLLRYKPVQYILQEAWFAGMKFYVDENVLIPRPETEELVELIVNESNQQNFFILDIGTGSGCIAISLKKKLLTSDVYGLDIIDEAIYIATKNALINNVEIRFAQANILDLDKQLNLPKFDIIVSNPPYIANSEAKFMDQNVLKFEPPTALFVPDDNPLIFYETIIEFALLHLNQNGKLYFEINEAYGEQVVNLLKVKRFSSVELKKDMQHKDRMVRAILKNQ